MPDIFDFELSKARKRVRKPQPVFKPNEGVKLEEVNEVDGESPIVNFIRRRRSGDLNETQPVEMFDLNRTSPSKDQWKAITAPSVVIHTKDEQIVVPVVPQDEIKIVHERPASTIPHFHVTYWMFYPFSQGKTVCTLNLGPLGPIPIPLVPIFNICLGTKKEFGSHVGDWEHMSLFFKGRMEPDVRNVDTFKLRNFKEFNS